MFKTNLQKDCCMYSCGKCVIATNKDQSFILHILQVRFESATATGIIWKLLECIESQILYIWTIFISSD